MKILCIGNIEREEFRILWDRLPADARLHCPMGARDDVLDWYEAVDVEPVGGTAQADCRNDRRKKKETLPGTAGTVGIRHLPDVREFLGTSGGLSRESSAEDLVEQGEPEALATLETPGTLVASEAPEEQAASTAQLQTLEPLAWILLLRSYPGEFAQSVVNQLKRQFPITPILTIQGSWCEGEAPLQKPTGTHLVYWYDFLTMFPQEWKALQDGQSSVWATPELGDTDAWITTAQRRETQTAEPRESRQRELTVAVFSEDYDLYTVLREQFLRDLVLAGNVRVFSANPAFHEAGISTFQNVDVLFCDMPDMGEASCAQFQRLCEAFPEAKRVAMLEFPRWNEWQWLEEHGALVLPKPFRWTDLREVMRTWI